jgi:hypothetical protein
MGKLRRGQSGPKKIRVPNRVSQGKMPMLKLELLVV